jgi:hypothetical protein
VTKPSGTKVNTTATSITPDQDGTWQVQTKTSYNWLSAAASLTVNRQVLDC